MSSYFPTSGRMEPASTRQAALDVQRRNPIEEMERRESLLNGIASEIRFVLPPTPQSHSPPPWERGNFVPLDGTRAAYELGIADEERRREGMSVCVRFPLTRKALWDCEAEGLPVHLTHASSIPSAMMPQSMIRALCDFLGTKQLSDAQQDIAWEFVGREVRNSCKASACPCPLYVRHATYRAPDKR
jgi:hypothetical protein